MSNCFERNPLPHCRILRHHPFLSAIPLHTSSSTDSLVQVLSGPLGSCPSTLFPLIYHDRSITRQGHPAEDGPPLRR